MKRIALLIALFITCFISCTDSRNKGKISFQVDAAGSQPLAEGKPDSDKESYPYIFGSGFIVFDESLVCFE